MHMVASAADFLCLAGEAAQASARDPAQDLDPRVSAHMCAEDCLNAGLPVPKACNDWEEADVVNSSISVCRVARNCLPEVDEDDAVTRAASRACLSLLLWFAASPAARAASTAADATKHELLLATVLQAVGNAVSSSEHWRAHVWDTAWPSLIVDCVLRDSLRCRGILGMIVYNAVRNNAAREAAFAHDEAAGDFLAAMLATTYGARAQVLSEAEIKHVEDVAEWTQLLISKLLQDGHLIAVHQRLSTMPKRLDADTEKQLWFLLEDIFTADADAAAKEEHEPLRLRDADYGYMATEFGIMITLCMQESQACAAQETDGDGGGARVVARMMQLLQVLGACTVRPSHTTRAALRSKGLIKTCAKLLESVSAVVPGADGARGRGDAADSGQGLSSQMGLKRDLVRVLANMCYEDRASQDEVREAGAIPLILACTNVDESNPFSKEWAILAVRNLCDNNLENQALIAKLQPQQVGSVPPELRQKGVGVKLDEHTGKIKVVRESDADQAAARSGAYLGVEHPSRRAEEMRDMGFGPSGGGGAASSSAGAGGGQAEDVEEMARSLREMGMHAEVDPDTGLMDISHPRSAPSRFHYPVRDTKEEAHTS